VLEIFNTKFLKLNKESKSSTIKFNNSSNKRNLLKYNITKLRIFWTRKTFLLMVWKRILILIRRISFSKKKRTQNNGKNGNKQKKRDLTTLRKKSKNIIKKTISYGTNSIKLKRPIGSKRIISTGLNGKWK